MAYPSKQSQIYTLVTHFLDGFPVGAKLPSERLIAQQLGIARNTLRPTLLRLAEEGFLERHVPRGTFVVRPQRKPIVYFALPCPEFLNESYNEHSIKCHRFLSKISRAIHQHQATLQFLYITDDNEYGHISEDNLSELVPGSCVIITAAWYMPAMPYFRKRGVRVVYIGETAAELGPWQSYQDCCHFFFMDRRKEAYNLYRHFYQQGARRIGLLGIYLYDNHPLRLGFMDAVRELNGDPTLLFSMPEQEKRGYETVAHKQDFFLRCLKDHQDVDAMMVMAGFPSYSMPENLRHMMGIPPNMKFGILSAIDYDPLQADDCVISHCTLDQSADQAVSLLLAPSWNPGVEFLPSQLN